MGRRQVWFGVSLAGRLLVLLLWSGAASAIYDDTVFLANGDRLTGDVKELARDQLRFKTDSLGTIYVQWEDIRSIETAKALRMELRSGRRLVGSIQPSETPEQMTVSTSRADENHAFEDVVAFVPLKLDRAWYNRIEGSVKFGLNGTKGSNTVQWSLGASALYQGSRFLVDSRYDSIITNKQDDTDTTRINFTNAYRHLLEDRWFWSVFGGYDKNDELGIDNRLSAGGGAGRYLLRSNDLEFLLTGGLLVSREFNVATVSSQLEGYISAQFAFFRYKLPKTDMSLTATVLPSLTDEGRVRSNTDVSLRREFIKDLFLDLSLYYTTDNQFRGTGEVVGSEDWGISTSLGYTF